MKNIFILNGNLKFNSFVDFLVDVYECIVKEMVNICIFRLFEMDFNLDFSFGYD